MLLFGYVLSRLNSLINDTHPLFSHSSNFAKGTTRRFAIGPLSTRRLLVPRFLNWFKTGVHIHHRRNNINILHIHLHSPNRCNSSRSRSNSSLITIFIPICIFSINISLRTGGSQTPKLVLDWAIRTLIPVHHINMENHRHRTIMVRIISTII